MSTPDFARLCQTLPDFSKIPQKGSIIGFVCVLLHKDFSKIPQKGSIIPYVAKRLQNQ